MTATKSQLPMIRSLKAIARRKANLSYFNIPVPEEVKHDCVRQAEAAKKKLNNDLRALFRRQNKSLLATLFLEQRNVPLNPAEEEQVAAFKALLDEVYKSAGATLSSGYVYSWQKEQKKRAEELFKELENIELQVIAGESVDLAPYAAALKS